MHGMREIVKMTVQAPVHCCWQFMHYCCCCLCATSCCHNGVSLANRFALVTRKISKCIHSFCCCFFLHNYCACWPYKLSVRFAVVVIVAFCISSQCNMLAICFTIKTPAISSGRQHYSTACVLNEEQ